MAERHRRRFGFMASLDFTAWPAEKVVSALAQLGYQAVEWQMAHFDPRRSREELAELSRLPERHGMVASEIVLQQDYVTLDRNTYRERIELSEAVIRAAAGAGINMVNVFTGPAPWLPNAPRLGIDISEGQAWQLVTDAYQRLVALAEDYRVYLAVETVFGHLVHDYYTLRQLLDQFDSEYLVVNLDPSHMVLYGNDVPWAIRRLGSRIRHVHLKDAVGKPGMPGREFCFPLLGEGNVDWTAFAAALDAVGYQGALSVEFESFAYYERVLKRDPVRAAALSMEAIRALFPGT